MLLGIVEGFYGRPWSWKARKDYLDFMKKIGFDFYIYAPKEDRYFREDWMKPLPKGEKKELSRLSAFYRERGIKWGVGFSPYNAYISFDRASKEKLKTKLNELNLLKPDIIAILFDDMKGDIPDIGKTQIKIMNFIRENTNSSKLLFCPTYYSFDPLLDKIFGKRPESYLEYLGKNLDRDIDIIWTGPLVRSGEITKKHLEEVSEMLGRKPFIWDNFIANDGEKHKKYLYIKPFRGRNRNILNYISGFMVNPMNQACLSQIPIITLADELGILKDYRFGAGTRYNPEESLERAVTLVCGRKHAKGFLEYVRDFLVGLDEIPEEKKKEMVKYFSSINEEWAREIVEWLEVDS